jgi:hypothetical protein
VERASGTDRERWRIVSELTPGTSDDSHPTVLAYAPPASGTRPAVRWSLFAVGLACPVASLAYARLSRDGIGLLLLASIGLLTSIPSFVLKRHSLLGFCLSVLGLGLNTYCFVWIVLDLLN